MCELDVARCDARTQSCCGTLPFFKAAAGPCPFFSSASSSLLLCPDCLCLCYSARTVRAHHVQRV